jgi:type I pantothenate kinase
VYVDADPDDIERWYIERFMSLRRSAFADPQSYFQVYAGLSDDDAAQTAARIWNEINLPNLVDNVLPTRHRARLILQKTADHTVGTVLLRKL